VQIDVFADFFPAPTEPRHLMHSSFDFRKEFTLSEMHHHEIARNQSQRGLVLDSMVGTVCDGPARESQLLTRKVVMTTGADIRG
jgi:hypothetical protein